MNRLYRIIGPCIVVTSLGLELFLGEGQHKLHTEQRQPEIQAELTKDISYSTDSIIRTQLFSTPEPIPPHPLRGDKTVYAY